MRLFCFFDQFFRKLRLPNAKSLEGNLRSCKKVHRQNQDNKGKIVNYYIHGFASGKNSATFGKIKRPSAKALLYDSTKTNQENMKSPISQVVYNKEPCYIIGSTLGGFYAI